MSANSFLITPQELDRHLGQPGLSIVDASWYLPAQKRLALPEFEEGHVPGAVFFDQDAVVEPGSSLPHALPSPGVFAEAMSALGVRETDTIVVYDGLGFFSAPRVWWLLRSFGARDVRLLDGGLPGWKAAGLALESGPARPREARFTVTFDSNAVVWLAEMQEIVASGSSQIADARPGDRFTGEAPEPREGMRSGHMPGARSLPFSVLARDGRLKSAAEIERAFRDAGIDPDAPVVTSCGSGVTAAAINFALAATGRDPGRLYDGSWSEWGGRDDTAVVTGPARGQA